MICLYRCPGLSRDEGNYPFEARAQAVFDPGKVRIMGNLIFPHINLKVETCLPRTWREFLWWLHESPVHQRMKKDTNSRPGCIPFLPDLVIKIRQRGMEHLQLYPPGKKRDHAIVNALLRWVSKTTPKMVNSFINENVGRLRHKALELLKHHYGKLVTGTVRVHARPQTPVCTAEVTMTNRQCIIVEGRNKQSHKTLRPNRVLVKDTRQQSCRGSVGQAFQ